MIVDSSALLAILNQEPESESFAHLIAADASSQISAATLLETSIVAGPARHGDVDDLLIDGAVEVATVDAEQARVARAAYARYGRGSGSRARLNFGDCFSYALAKVADQPLLFKGDDFVYTDVEAAG